MSTAKVEFSPPRYPKDKHALEENLSNVSHRHICDFSFSRPNELSEACFAIDCSVIFPNTKLLVGLRNYVTGLESDISQLKVKNLNVQSKY